MLWTCFGVELIVGDCQIHQTLNCITITRRDITTLFSYSLAIVMLHCLHTEGRISCRSNWAGIFNFGQYICKSPEGFLDVDHLQEAYLGPSGFDACYPPHDQQSCPWKASELKVWFLPKLWGSCWSTNENNNHMLNCQLIHIQLAHPLLSSEHRAISWFLNKPDFTYTPISFQNSSSPGLDLFFPQWLLKHLKLGIFH